MSSYVANAALVAGLLVSGTSAQSSKGFTYEMGSRDPPGPDFWAAIPGGACNGISQSPIDVPPPPSFFTADTVSDYEMPGSCPLDFPSMNFEPGTCTLGDGTFTIDGAEIKLSYPSSGCDLPGVTINGERYSVLQWHSHHRSEHTFAGKHRGGVLHIVHVSDSNPNQLAVVGVTYNADSDTENELLAPYLSKFQEDADAQASACGDDGRRLRGAGSMGMQRRLQGNDTANPNDGLVADPYVFVPTGTNFFTYSGGLTTPPCSEIVRWFVLEDPLLISIKQYTTIESWILNHKNDDCVLDTIASGAGDTFRPTQPLNGRKVRYCETA